MRSIDQHAIRLQAAMLLAEAALQQLAGAKLGQCHYTPDGFAYDVDAAVPLSEAELAPIEQRMRDLARDGVRPVIRHIGLGEAVRLFEARGERWKADWLSRQYQGKPAATKIAVYERGGFADLCPEDIAPGPLEPALPVLKLLNVAGAYWLGDSRNAVLQRIYGVAFASHEELQAYEARLAEAERRDHRKLGKQLRLFMFTDDAPGMPFYLPKGTVVRSELEKLSRDYLRRYDYEEVRTPFIMNRRLWEQSGHWEHYRDNMYFSEMEHQHVAVKPMNCPGHMLIFKHELRSYRDLPLRLAEFGQVHRYEFSGALNGLFRVRTFCQDDAHIFATPSQIREEAGRAVELIQAIYGIFGFEYSLELSTRPADSMGSDEQWELAENALASVLEAAGLPYSVNPGDGAFYGPKIDFHIKDALNRSHQCGTVQLDFQMPEKFGLSYVDERNERETPIVIHRAVYGSIDRFLGILLEHYAGALPMWLAPVQAIVLPVSEAHAAYGAELRRRLDEAGIRAELDSRNEKLGYRLREAQLQKIPYTVVVRDAEQADGSVQVRAYGRKEQARYDREAFAAMLQEKIRQRA